MDRLPLEVLCDIFKKTIPRRGDRDQITYSASVSAPLYISHVCRTWRTVSLSCGELWSHLYMDYEDNNWTQKQRIVKVFDTWLARTNRSPLNFALRIWCLCEDPETHRAAEHKVVALLEQHRRWKDVEFSCYLIQHSPNPLIKIDLRDMPMLTSLKLGFHLSTRDHRMACATVDISQSPRLENLDLEGNFILFTGDETMRTMRQGTLIFRNTAEPQSSIHSCLRLLEISPFLTHFMTNFVTNDIESSFLLRNQHPMELHHLRSLVLDNRYASAFIINNMTLPSLQALQINWYGKNLRSEMLLGLVRRSMPPLARLEVSGNIADEDKLIPILYLLPALEDLRVEEANVTARLFRELTVTNVVDEGNLVVDERIVCPSLISLRLKELEFPDVTVRMKPLVEPLTNMIKSRWKILRTFRKVTLDFCVGPSFSLDVSDIDSNLGIVQECLVERESTLIVESDETR